MRATYREPKEMPLCRALDIIHANKAEKKVREPKEMPLCRALDTIHANKAEKNANVRVTTQKWEGSVRPDSPRVRWPGCSIPR